MTWKVYHHRLSTLAACKDEQQKPKRTGQRRPAAFPQLCLPQLEVEAAQRGTGDEQRHSAAPTSRGTGGASPTGADPEDLPRDPRQPGEDTSHAAARRRQDASGGCQELAGRATRAFWKDAGGGPTAGTS